MTLRRIFFWVGVGGVSLISPLVLNVAADKLPLPGLRRMRDYLTNTKPGS